MDIFKKLMMACLLLALPLQQGCAVLAAGAVAGGGTYVYTTGQLVRTYNASLDTSYEATVRAARRLNLKVNDRVLNLSSASVNGHDKDRRFWISLKSENPRVTKISVRVGVLGDEAASRRIHEAIARSL
ncbi:DUF3568 family protein [Desulfobaculum bizertense]|uniref:DUF3568 family protein n=1 Tax=Desulfobaculum bizertense DSM 18034 TaxID=1121442 RepID=A0A1T4WN53_9BACT|nr:DUF3568 family protein [Desulfobaculum bizertense]UIJ39342.1 DUF3568 domain-containing protein [Desulfobaculum bizertense]SKA78773.1 Protein of unknown function [Desulfobaculum bizertense DSM 18034]